jgi:hypothetical protein
MTDTGSVKGTKEVEIAASVAGDVMLSFSVAELPLGLSAEETERLRALYPQPLAVSDAGTWEFCGVC